jgi:hypothetical protein
VGAPSTSVGQIKSYIERRIRSEVDVVSEECLGRPVPEGYIGRMTVEKSLFDSPEAEAKSEARAEADVKAGRVISHEAVRRWLSSWGSSKRLPRPRPGE